MRYAQRHVSGKQLPAAFINPIRKIDYTERPVVLQKRPQKIAFIPRPVFVHDPGCRILERKKNVMDMNQYAGRQRRENPEHIIQHIASGLRYMRGIDEEYVARGEFRKHIERNVL